MAKRYNTRAIKTNHPYTVEEAAEVLGVHEQTVRAWFLKGLRVLRSKTPHIILGDDLKQFLDKQQARRRRPLRPNELYCLKCRAPKVPLGNLADYIPDGEERGRLAGLCPDCENQCHRFIRCDQIGVQAPNLDVASPACVNSLNEPIDPA